MRTAGIPWRPALNGSVALAVAGLARSTAEEAGKGNLQVQLLQQILTRLPAPVSSAPAASTPAGLEAVPSLVEVQIFWHDEGLDLNAAWSLKGRLEGRGLRCKITPHKDRTAPDALFIGALVGAEEARTVLESLPYEVKYLFRPDYPQGAGGSDSGLLIGIGYMSSHVSDPREPRFRPVPVSPAQLAELAKPGLTNTGFQTRLRSLTLPNGAPRA